MNIIRYLHNKAREVAAHGANFEMKHCEEEAKNSFYLVYLLEYEAACKINQKMKPITKALLMEQAIIFAMKANEYDKARGMLAYVVGLNLPNNLYRRIVKLSSDLLVKGFTSQTS